MKKRVCLSVHCAFPHRTFDSNETYQDKVNVKFSSNKFRSFPPSIAYSFFHQSDCSSLSNMEAMLSSPSELTECIIQRFSVVQFVSNSSKSIWLTIQMSRLRITLHECIRMSECPFVDSLCSQLLDKWRHVNDADKNIVSGEKSRRDTPSTIQSLSNLSVHWRTHKRQYHSREFGYISMRALIDTIMESG